MNMLEEKLNVVFREVHARAIWGLMGSSANAEQARRNIDKLREELGE